MFAEKKSLIRGHSFVSHKRRHYSSLRDRLRLCVKFLMATLEVHDKHGIQPGINLPIT